MSDKSNKDKCKYKGKNKDKKDMPPKHTPDQVCEAAGVLIGTLRNMAKEPPKITNLQRKTNANAAIFAMLTRELTRLVKKLAAMGRADEVERLLNETIWTRARKDDMVLLLSQERFLAEQRMYEQEQEELERQAEIAYQEELEYQEALVRQKEIDYQDTLAFIRGMERLYPNPTPIGAEYAVVRTQPPSMCIVGFDPMFYRTPVELVD